MITIRRAARVAAVATIALRSPDRHSGKRLLHVGLTLPELERLIETAVAVRASLLLDPGDPPQGPCNP